MPRCLLTPFALCCVLTAGVPLGAAEKTADWPSWRGPNRDAISSETGLLDQWPQDGPPLAYLAKGVGSGYSSVSVADGRVYTMGKKGRAAKLFALDAADGAILWEAEIGGGEPNCTPTVDSDRVYALGRDGDFVCVEAKTGKELWRKSFPRDFGGRMMSGWGYSESPLIDGDRLICTPGARDAMIVALDKQTGEVIWKAAEPQAARTRGNDGAGYSSIVISGGGGVKQYVQLTGHGMISVAADDGRTLWTYGRIANGTANIPTPLVKDNYVFCSTGYGDGGTALLRINRRGRRGVELQEVYYKSSGELQNHHGGMIMLGDYVYLGHGHNNGFPTCVEWKTGRIVWGKKLRGEGTGSAAIVYADGNLYFRYENGQMALIEATPREYRVKGSFRLASVQGQSWPHPVISGGRLYLRDQDALMCYDLKK